MQVHFFTIPVHAGEEAAEELNRFLAGHRIVSVDRQLVQDGANSAWTLCISFEQPGQGRPQPPRRGKVDYREVLNDADFTVYARLRSLRKEIAETDGVPLYALFTNEQMAEMVTRRASSVSALREIAGTVAVGHMRRFRIRDPKPRIIHAPCFRERVLHHALMAHVGPVLDRALIDDTYACRVGKGTLAAVQRAQHHMQRFPWYAKIDIRAYFASVDHGILLALLARRFKDRGLLGLLARIVGAHQTDPGKGLPIGALTSQHFANYYLSGLDRLLLEGCRVRGLVRYMDDLVWWGETRDQVRDALAAARADAADRLRLDIKSPVQVGRSLHGLMLCGYRILPGRLLLSRRRKRRYAECRQGWEDAYSDGLIDARTLQAGYATALAITAHADAAAWRREQLRRRPLAETLAAV